MNIDKLKLQEVFETAGIKNSSDLVATVEELIQQENTQLIEEMTELKLNHSTEIDGLKESNQVEILKIKAETSKDQSSLIEANIKSIEEQENNSKDLFNAVTEENADLKYKVSGFEDIKESLVEFTLEEADKEFNSQLKMFFKKVAEEWVNENDAELDTVAESTMADIASITISEALTNAGFTLSADEQSIATKMTDLEEELNIVSEQNEILVSAMKEIQKEVLIEESVQGLTSIDADKIRAVAENITYNDKESFNKALQFMQESISTEVIEKKPVQEDVIVEVSESTELNHDDIIKATLALYS